MRHPARPALPPISAFDVVKLHRDLQRARKNLAAAITRCHWHLAAEHTAELSRLLDLMAYASVDLELYTATKKPPGSRHTAFSTSGDTKTVLRLKNRPAVHVQAANGISAP